jgi:AcrR family transcriptional regulator
MSKTPAKGGRKVSVTEAKRKQIVAAMTQTALSMKQISAKFGVPVSTIYYQIGSRRDLLAA